MLLATDQLLSKQYTSMNEQSSSLQLFVLLVVVQLSISTSDEKIEEKTMATNVFTLSLVFTHLPAVKKVSVRHRPGPMSFPPSTTGRAARWAGIMKDATIHGKHRQTGTIMQPSGRIK